MFKKISMAIIAAIVMVGGLTACSSDADLASENLSKDADNFKIMRRVIFVNGITDKYLLQIEGLCSLGNNDDKYTTVTCKLPDGKFVKHFLLRSDNVTVVVEQMVGADVSTAHYKMIFKPSALIPAVEIR